MVRKRYIGDRNSVFAGRDFNELQSARGLVYADGLLLSNLLGSSYAYPPRWSLIAPTTSRASTCCTARFPRSIRATRSARPCC
jgi:hypothetical protein